MANMLTKYSPVSDYWTFSVAPQNCINEGAHILAAGIINTCSDFCVVLIPIPVVMKLKLPLRQRIVCALLFGAGFIVCIAGGFRIAYMYQLNTTYDKTWLAFPTWICGTIELYLGIVSLLLIPIRGANLLTIQIATSIPAIKPLVMRYFPTILGNTFTRQGYGNSSNGYVKTFDSYVDRSGAKSPFSEARDIDLVKIHSAPLKNKISVETTVSLSTEKRLPVNSPSVQRPVNSAFSSFSRPNPLRLSPSPSSHVPDAELDVEKGLHASPRPAILRPSPFEDEGRI
jgi:hypothetical protein